MHMRSYQNLHQAIQHATVDMQRGNNGVASLTLLGRRASRNSAGSLGKWSNRRLTASRTSLTWTATMVYASILVGWRTLRKPDGSCMHAIKLRLDGCPLAAVLWAPRSLRACDLIRSMDLEDIRYWYAASQSPCSKADNADKHNLLDWSSRPSSRLLWPLHSSSRYGILKGEITCSMRGSQHRRLDDLIVRSRGPRSATMLGPLMIEQV
jgi:hypothetical protein